MNQLAIDFLSKDFPKPQLPVISLTAKELKKFTGYYAPRAPRSQLLAFLWELEGGTWIRVADGKLQCSGLFGKSAELLLPVGKNVFRGEKEPEATAVFFPHAAGGVIFFLSRGGGEAPREKEFPRSPDLRLWVFAAPGVVIC